MFQRMQLASEAGKQLDAQSLFPDLYGLLIQTRLVYLRQR